MKKIIATLALLFLAIPTQPSLAFTIPRADVLECGLSDGSKFILRDEYRWDPVAELIPADVTTTYGRGTSYDVRFISTKGRVDKHVPVGVPRQNGCANVGLFNGVPLVNGSYQKKDLTWFPPTMIPEKLHLSDLNQPEPIRTLLRDKELTPKADLAFVLPKTGRLVFERPLQKFSLRNFQAGIHERPDGELNITAVYKSISTDNGNTWSDPVITTDAEIFELGKSLGEQSFVGNPLRYNGQKLEDAHVKKTRLEMEEKRRIVDVRQAEMSQQQSNQQRYIKTLDSAIEKNDQAHFAQLLATGVDINAPADNPFRNDKKAPLLVAIDKPEYAPFAITLIQRGASLTPKGIYEGVTVLMLAAGSSTPEVMQALLAKQKFDINQRNPNGETALSYAVTAGMAANVKFLLERGADVSVKSGEGSLIEIARQQGYTEIVKLLEQRRR